MDLARRAHLAMKIMDGTASQLEQAEYRDRMSQARGSPNFDYAPMDVVKLRKDTLRKKKSRDAQEEIELSVLLRCIDTHTGKPAGVCNKTIYYYGLKKDRQKAAIEAFKTADERDGAAP